MDAQNRLQGHFSSIERYLSHGYNLRPHYYRSASVGTAALSPISAFHRPAGMPGYFPHMNGAAASFVQFPSPAVHPHTMAFVGLLFPRGRTHLFHRQSVYYTDLQRVLQSRNTTTIPCHLQGRIVSLLTFTPPRLLYPLTWIRRFWKTNQLPSRVGRSRRLGLCLDPLFIRRSFLRSTIGGPASNQSTIMSLMFQIESLVGHSLSDQRLLRREIRR